MEISNKNIIITGGANGIGLETAKALRLQQANVIILDIDEQSLEKLKNENSEFSCYKCDITDPEDISKTLKKIIQAHNQIDVLINNAGAVKDSPLIKIFGQIEKHDIDLFERIIKINLFSVFLMTREIAAHMFEKRIKGVIVNVSSVASHGNPGQSAYSAAKAGINALTYTWANELNYLGIRVAAIAPGFTETNIVKSNMNEKLQADIKKKTPLKRMAEPSEIADGILFIIKNDFFHGKILPLDGGLVI
ncbi:MAG: 3-ketoacyl-(Acyl-carrier-protein) reductase [Candidatus Peregrinibacteria bacterium GW2011_GWA2_33_10]|nr:MAG: 3-ketoacyl-(Acyl-carrier-protein) reductase [Candidatus Peregrinibacteria bacterium GW2011_GWA2_33_10]KKP38881.1 MAG: 3-ketoacyl-ACP reductase, 3-oxoacyl-[acyl-carrier protein] reductase [Candidatus Peregrinibacteria bacterium GW2011_GWC2_33_13]OGJ46724.1 MAG: hypothetical protein A2229_05620 [Candidatus Peregrinibacteria bacterium RIFOXYA2_FULL_33_7]